MNKKQYEEKRNSLMNEAQAVVVKHFCNTYG